MKMNRINYKMFWLIVGLSFGFLVGCEKNKEKSLEKGQGIICDFENIKVWCISPERGFNLSLSSELNTCKASLLYFILKKHGYA